MRALSQRLHAEHKLLTVAVAATNFHGRNYLDEVVADVDFLNIMAYDDGYRQPGVHHSSYLYAEEALGYWLVDRGVPADKAVLGLPFYARSLYDRHSRTYRSICEEDREAPGKDRSGEYGYNGIATIRAKTLEIARAKAGGVMIWQLNQDARGEESLLNAIFDAVKEDWEPSRS
jgi:GH18 family chitinase